MQGLNREEPDQTGCTHEYWQRRKQVCVVVGGREWGLWGRGKGELEGEGRGGEEGRKGGSWVYTQRLTQSYGEVNPAPAPLEGQQLTWLWTILQLNGPAFL